MLKRFPSGNATPMRLSLFLPLPLGEGRSEGKLERTLICSAARYRFPLALTPSQREGDKTRSRDRIAGDPLKSNPL